MRVSCIIAEADHQKRFLKQVNPFQEKDMHLCAAKCCDSQTSSIEDVHRCVERCQESTMMAQKFVQSELERFQESLSRCVLQCQDEVKDKVARLN